MLSQCAVACAASRQPKLVRPAASGLGHRRRAENTRDSGVTPPLCRRRPAVPSRASGTARPDRPTIDRAIWADTRQPAPDGLAGARRAGTTAASGPSRDESGADVSGVSQSPLAAATQAVSTHLTDSCTAYRHLAPLAISGEFADPAPAKC